MLAFAEALSFLVLFLGIISMVILRRHWKPLLPLYATVIGITLFYAPYTPEARYTLPARPEMMALIAIAASSWTSGWRGFKLRTYDFSDFKSALDFVVKIGEIAEREGHHPDILLRWGKVTVTIWTHKIDGLTESDFILAAKINRLPR